MFKLIIKHYFEIDKPWIKGKLALLEPAKSVCIFRDGLTVEDFRVDGI